MGWGKCRAVLYAPKRPRFLGPLTPTTLTGCLIHFKNCMREENESPVPTLVEIKLYAFLYIKCKGRDIGAIASMSCVYINL